VLIRSLVRIALLLHAVLAIFVFVFSSKIHDDDDDDELYRPVFGRIPGPNRAWLSAVYVSRQASQLSVYQSRDYRVYIPNTYAA